MGIACRQGVVGSDTAAIIWHSSLGRPGRESSDGLSDMAAGANVEGSDGPASVGESIDESNVSTMFSGPLIVLPERRVDGGSEGDG